MGFCISMIKLIQNKQRNQPLWEAFCKKVLWSLQSQLWKKFDQIWVWLLVLFYNHIWHHRGPCHLNAEFLATLEVLFQYLSLWEWFLIAMELFLIDVAQIFPNNNFVVNPWKPWMKAALRDCSKDAGSILQQSEDMIWYFCFLVCCKFEDVKWSNNRMFYFIDCATVLAKTARKDIVSPWVFLSSPKDLPKLCLCAVKSQPVNTWQRSRCSKFSFSVELISHECLLLWIYIFFM